MAGMCLGRSTHDIVLKHVQHIEHKHRTARQRDTRTTAAEQRAHGLSRHADSAVRTVALTQGRYVALGSAFAVARSCARHTRSAKISFYSVPSYCRRLKRKFCDHSLMAQQLLQNDLTQGSTSTRRAWAGARWRGAALRQAHVHRGANRAKRAGRRAW